MFCPLKGYSFLFSAKTKHIVLLRVLNSKSRTGQVLISSKGEFKCYGFGIGKHILLLGIFNYRDGFFK